MNDCMAKHALKTKDTKYGSFSHVICIWEGLAVSYYGCGELGGSNFAELSRLQ
jgi:hypothetical protein